MHFVALDGEGIDEKYCLLQDSEGGELFDIGGLGTEQVFHYLLKRGIELSTMRPIFIGFVTTYDVNMILRDLDDETLKKIFRTDDKEFIEWSPSKDNAISFNSRYEILYIPRKVFKLRATFANGDRFSFTWYDVYTFFGSSFISACCGFLGEIPREIVEGKAARSTFKRRDLARIRRYNQLEVQWLVKLCEKLNEIFLSQGMTITKWHGPGAVAEFVLGKKSLNVHTEYPIFRENEAPAGLWQAWDCAYYGGRFENMGIGTFENVYSFDINSAYPYAISQLNILDYASRWTHQNRPRFPTFGSQAVYLVEWSLPYGQPFGPFPWRDTQGRIFYPLNGLGWYWAPEVIAALENPRWKDRIKLWEVWHQNEGEASIFQQAIPHLYALRNELKQKGNSGEYALKIALNSIYGKFAQKVGQSPFKCIPWAGWITSNTRALLLRASMGREHEILSFATDAIFSRSRLSLPLGSNLGAWKAEKHAKFLILMNGFYRLDDVTRKRKSATRGLPPIKDVPESEKDVTWEALIMGLNESQEYSYKFTQFVTHSMAIHFPNKFGKDRLRFVENTKTLKPFQNTRRVFQSQLLKNWEKDFTVSKPVKFPTIELSFPSSLPYASVTLEEDEENA